MNKYEVSLEKICDHHKSILSDRISDCMHLLKSIRAIMSRFILFVQNIDYHYKKKPRKHSQSHT